MNYFIKILFISIEFMLKKLVYIVITLDKKSPNSSNFYFKGVCSALDSSSANFIEFIIWPKYDCIPVQHTTPTEVPFVINVPLNSIFYLDIISLPSLIT